MFALVVQIQGNLRAMVFFLSLSAIVTTWVRHIVVADISSEAGER
jgi:hypothetical protein